MISKIFSSDYNIFNFIKDVLSDHKKWHDPLYAALQLIETLFKKYSRHMCLYFNITLKECVKNEMSGIDANGKAKFLIIICIVLEEGFAINNQFDDLQTVHDKYFQFLKTSDTKTSGSGKFNRHEKELTVPLN